MMPDSHRAEQQTLFPEPDAADRPTARPLPVATRGRDEVVVRCPRCAQMHRHIHYGLVTAPCKARYYVQPKKRARAA